MQYLMQTGVVKTVFKGRGVAYRIGELGKEVNESSH